jgi:hypothetical protein
VKERNGERIHNLDINETGTFIDLSTSGVAMLLPVAKEKGREVIVCINDLKIKSKVIYCCAKGKKFRVGLHFQNVSSEMCENLSDLIDKFSRGVPVNCILEDTPFKA